MFLTGRIGPHIEYDETGRGLGSATPVTEWGKDT